VAVGAAGEGLGINLANEGREESDTCARRQPQVVLQRLESDSPFSSYLRSAAAESEEGIFLKATKRRSQSRSGVWRLRKVSLDSAAFGAQNRLHCLLLIILIWGASSESARRARSLVSLVGEKFLLFSPSSV